MARKEPKVKEKEGKVAPAETPKVPETPSAPQGLRRVKVSEEELMKFQNEGKLVGYDPATQEAIIK